jgi:predicted TIM-barrel fold metal-dependent hydrolase
MPIEKYIDAHSHVWTHDTTRYPIASTFRVDDMKPASFAPDELLRLCRPSGVGRVNLIQMSYYRFDNSYILDMIARYPDRFVGTAIVDPLGVDPAKAMSVLVPRGIRAFRIAPNFSGKPAANWLEPPGYAAMFAAAERLNVSLSCLIDPSGFAEVDRMCAKHPNTRVIVDHIGRIGIDGSIRDSDVSALKALARHKNLYIKIGAFYALGLKKPPYLDLAPLIKSIVAAFGVDRCMWESDCPFQVVEHKYEDSIALIRDRIDGLSRSDRDFLLYRTAERLLFKRT